MTVKEFVEKYNRLLVKEKKQFLKNHITSKYVDISIKQMIAQACINKCVTLNDKNILYFNEFLYEISQTLSVVALYTDLQLDQKDSYGDYDLIVKNNLIEEILSVIDKCEYEEIFKVFTNLRNNWYNENASIEAVVMKVINSFSGLADMLLKDVDKNVNNNN